MSLNDLIITEHFMFYIFIYFEKEKTLWNQIHKNINFEMKTCTLTSAHMQ